MECKNNNDIFVSTELDTIHFLMKLFSADFYNRLSFIKSSYQYARVDFMILNTDNLKSIVVETKEWLKRKPNYEMKNTSTSATKVSKPSRPPEESTSSLTAKSSTKKCMLS